MKGRTVLPPPIPTQPVTVISIHHRCLERCRTRTSCRRLVTEWRGWDCRKKEPPVDLREFSACGAGRSPAGDRWSRRDLRDRQGLVPDTLVGSPAFMVAVTLGAALTVFLASRTGIPISTTHSLTGALVGAGFVAMGLKLGFSALGKNFFIPLFLSPVIAFGSAVIFYPLFHWARQKAGITRDSCVCAGAREAERGLVAAGTGVSFSTVTMPTVDVFVGNEETCDVQSVEMYQWLNYFG